MLNEKVCRILYCFAMGAKPIRALQQHTLRRLSLRIFDRVTSKIRIFSPGKLDRLFFRLKKLLLALCGLAVRHDEFQVGLVRVATRNFVSCYCGRNSGSARDGSMHGLMTFHGAAITKN